jgi:hypothetical protein
MTTGVTALKGPLNKRCRLVRYVLYAGGFLLLRKLTTLLQCRFMTVLYFLADTEQGGGTVFPLADKNETEYEAWKQLTDNNVKYKQVRSQYFFAAISVFHLLVQTRTCSPGLSVKPAKGKAIMWYNHHVDRGYLGNLDKRSLHGGCNIIQGTKWIANHWMTALPHPDVPRSAAKSHYNNDI